MIHLVLLLTNVIICLHAQQIPADPLNASLTATYSGSAAASWAVSCIPGCSECPECLNSNCACGCTYFTTRKSL